MLPVLQAGPSLDDMAEYLGLVIGVLERAGVLWLLQMALGLSILLYVGQLVFSFMSRGGGR
jgi:hypothetical protein